ncbi:MAG: NAD(P)/FAD-dependent oxidoreductase [Atopobiaceae bacterium]|nr:NAD(P)/FAD-dependent oxidoreductase [Atopobiaceae bacterium]
MYDVIIIGAGVTGCAVARELSRYEANVCVIESEEDFWCGTSKAHSSIVHAGFDCTPGTLMARFNVRGNEMMEDLAKDLEIPFKRNGSLVVCIHKEELGGLQDLYDRGIANGVPDMKILSREELLEMEPNLSDNVEGALYAPTGGIICPFKLNIAMAENANVNGVDFFFNTRAEKLTRDDEGLWHIRTNNGEYITRYVVNAAGLYSDYFHNMVSENKIHITPRRGDYCILDKETGDLVEKTIFPQPTKMGKGILVAPTIHGNLFVGPTAINMDDDCKDFTATTQEGIAELIEKGGMYVKDLPIRKVITSFAGNRAHEDGHEFILGEPEDAPHFIDCAGIESPGLTSSPAIGEYIGEMMRDMMGLKEKDNWIATRKDVVSTEGLSLEERNELIKENPAYGTIICRCESVTEGEILDAIHRPLGARSLDGVKRRTRAGTGRCQAGFCSPRVMEILQRELDLPMEEITKTGGKSAMVFGRTKLEEGAR